MTANLFRLYLIVLLGCCEQSTGSEDVLTTTGTYGGEHTVLGEIVAKVFHLLVVGTMKGHVGDGVEAYEIDPALQTIDKAHYLASMHHRVVDTAEDDILE